MLLHNIIQNDREANCCWLTSILCFWETLKLTQKRFDNVNQYCVCMHVQDEEELTQISEKDGQAQASVRDMRQKVEEAKSSLSSTRSRGKVLDALMQQKRSGKIPGILGRLVRYTIQKCSFSSFQHLSNSLTKSPFHAVSFQGDLGAIDEKYDIAISSSCGALDNIVVDTIDTAQKCVTFLKAQNIGVATFIGLDKVLILLSTSILVVTCGIQTQAP